MAPFKRATLRYGRTPEPETPYKKPGQVWDDRIGTPRAQARNWRLMALGALGLAATLSVGLFWLATTGTSVPYIIEVDSQGGIKSVGAAKAGYRPSDAQIAHHLARFIDNVRSVSIDPVIVRKSWLTAYDYATAQAAQTLNDFARKRDPFSTVGKRAITTQVTSVVRASLGSFQIRWQEKTYDGGALIKTQHFTGLLTIVIDPPSTPEAIRKNPLGIYVHNISWSADLELENAQ